MIINGTEIGKGLNPYIIAEMSGNHLNSLDSALELMEASARAGVNAFKLQTYSANTLTINCLREEYIVRAGPWNGRTLHDLYSQGHTPNEWLEPLFQLAKELNLTLFSTPFGIKEVDILEGFDVPVYKVASFEITYTQLLKKIASTNKPVIFSTGLASIEEISKAIQVLQDNGSGSIAMLKCTTSYPANSKDLNLNTINFLGNKYQIPVGFSDHTLGVNSAIAAAGAGACIFEKHIKLDKDISSVDSSFALPVSKLSEYISNIREATISMGVIQDGPCDSEKQYLKYRRSIVAAQNIYKGDIITKDNIVIVRPNIGIAPEFLDSILGKKVIKDLEFGQGITVESLDI